MKLNLKEINENNNTKSSKRSFWKRAKTSRLTLFLLFVIISASLWFVQSLKYYYNNEYIIPVQYDSIPMEYGLGGTLPYELKVIIKDRGKSLLAYDLEDRERPIILNWNNHVGGKRHLTFGHGQLIEEMQKRFSTATTIVAMQPEGISVPIFPLEQKQVEVLADYSINSASGFRVTNIDVSPKQTTIYGKGETLKNISHLFAESTNLQNLTADAIYKVPLTLPEYVLADPNEVTISIKVEELTERTIEMPIKTINVPDQYDLRLLPKTVQVRVTLPLSNYDELNSETFDLYVDYNEVAAQIKAGQEEIEFQIGQRPSWVVNVITNNNSVSYIIEYTN